MIVFKTFLKVLNKCKAPVILYLVFLIIFSSFSVENAPVSSSFTEEKARVVIFNHDEEVGLTKHLIDYLGHTCSIVDIEKDMVDDSLFYRDIHLILEIPEGYHTTSKNAKTLSIKQNGTYDASLARMHLERYLKTTQMYQKMGLDESEVMSRSNQLLETEVMVDVKTKVDVDSLDKATAYYNFTNYTILAGCIYAICLVLSSFHEERVERRVRISSMPIKKHNRILLGSNLLFASFFWLITILLSVFVVGNIILSMHGILYMINAFCFLVFACSLAFLISNLIKNKNAINGIVNVIALGSSFLCGAFVPVELLPSSVLTFAHVLPSYYFIQTNELIAQLELVDWTTISPLMINMGIILLFALGIFLIHYFIAKRKISSN